MDPDQILWEVTYPPYLQTIFSDHGMVPTCVPHVFQNATAPTNHK